METSETINELAAALSKAQGKITGALKDSSNPFFKSKYADLAACWDACRAPLTECGLAVIQTTQDGEHGTTVVTRLVHSSGQWVQGRLTLNPKDHTPQAVGSTLTYARRYALAAIVGLAQIDDDANAGSGKQASAIHADDKGGSRDMEAKLLASNFAAALKSGVDVNVMRVHTEANGDQELYGMAWKLLDATSRALFKKSLDRARATIATPDNPEALRQ